MRNPGFRSGSRRISSADFEWIFESMPIPILLLSPNLIILAVNDAYLMATLTTRTDLLGKYLFDIFPGGFPLPATAEDCDIEDSIKRVLESSLPEAVTIGGHRNPDLAAPTETPRHRRMRLVHAPLMDDQGELNYIIQYIDDISHGHESHDDMLTASVLEKQFQGELLQLAQTRSASQIEGDSPGAGLYTDSSHSHWPTQGLPLESIPDSIPDSMLVIDRHWRIDITNTLAASAHGETKESMIGRDFRAYVEAPAIQAVQQVMDEQHFISCEYFATTSARWWDLRMSPTLDGGVVILMRDITERKLAEARQLHAAQHDMLTGLSNRRLFQQDAERTLAWSRRLGQKVAVLFIDLDEFKPVNDNYGHEVGDLLLKQVADRLTLLLRAADLIGRHGGDEFTAVLVSIENATDVAHIADNILEALSRPYQIDDLSLRVTASIGISIFPEDGEAIEQLIRNADCAMYESKNSGRAQCRFYRDGVTRQPPQERKNSMESRVRKALNSGEFSLVFQPVFNTSTQQVVEAEALIRWRQRDGSYIHPDVFLPIAELTGLISPIGEWLLNTACDQQQRWKADGLPDISIAVKIPGAQFRQKGFDKVVAKILRATGLPPSRLLLEVTENAVQGNTEESARIIKALKAMGISVAITNFGAGNSNVRALSQLPIDKLKVDRSYMQHVYSSGEQFAASDAIIGLGHSLHKEIVAQGIENEDDMAYVRSHGCQYSQGYLLAPPMPPGEFSRWWMQSAASGHITRH